MADDGRVLVRVECPRHSAVGGERCICNRVANGYGVYALVGRDALMQRLGLTTLAMHDAHARYRQDRSGENSALRWEKERERDAALAELRAFDAREEGDRGTE